jgi:hypothetical protein
MIKYVSVGFDRVTVLYAYFDLKGERCLRVIVFERW